MARGAPDYAPVAAEVLGEIEYTSYSLHAGGTVSAGSYALVNLGTVEAGYEIYQAIGTCSAQGCDTVHQLELYIGLTLKRTVYFDIETTVFYPRHFIALAGETMFGIFYNYDAVDRAFMWSAIGIYLAIGTPKPNPQLLPGKPPKLGKDEQLWLVEDTLLGAHWVKAKQHKIEKVPKRIKEFMEGKRGELN